MDTAKPIFSLVPPAYQAVVETQLVKLFVDADPKNPFYSDKAKESLAYLKKEVKVGGKKKLIKDIDEEWSTTGLIGTGYKIGAYGGDDAIYQSNPYLQEILPRGLLYINDELVIFAFPKFFGLQSGDDDDTNMTQKVNESATHFLMTNKANGEMAHIAWHQASQNWVIGSKNRKIIANNQNDLAQFENKECYTFAVAIAKQWFILLSQMRSEDVTNLQKFLTQSRLTLIFEIEQTNSQHVVPLYIDRLVLIGVSAIYAPQGLHPAFTYALSKFLKCSCVVSDPTPIPLEQLNEMCDRVSMQWESEGAVIYLLDDDNRVMQMIKKKAWWYIILRAIREKIRSNLKTNSAYMCQQQTKRRLNEIHTDFSIPSQFIQQFIKLSDAFIAWFFSHMLAEAKDEATDIWQKKFIDQYPLVWREFLLNNKLPVDHSLLTAPLDKFIDFKQFQIPDPALLVMFQGIPGLGKNYLAEHLSQALIAVNVRTTVIDQDSFHQEHGPEKSGQVCFDEVQRQVFSGTYDVVLLARNNAYKLQYARYLSFPKYIILSPEEMHTNPLAVIALSTSSVLARKKNSNQHTTSTKAHPTDKMDQLELATLPFKFAAGYTASPVSFRFKFLDDKAIVGFTAEQKVLFQSELDRIRTYKKNAFSADSMTQEVYDKLDFVNPLTFRRPYQELVAEMVPVIKLIGLSGNVPLENQYIGIQLDPESRDQLNDLLDKYPGQTMADHVTLTHSNTYQRDSSYWGKAIKLLDKSVTMISTRYKSQTGKVTAMEIVIQDPLVASTKCLPPAIATLGAVQVNQAVESGVPHLTLKLHGAQAVYSASMMKDATVEWIQLSEPLILTGKVTIMGQ